MLKRLISILLIFLPVILYADVTLNDEEYNKLIDRLEKDKQIIYTNDVRWKRLENSKPEITYTVEEDKTIIQSIEIPIYKANSLTYEVSFEIQQEEETKGIFPLTIFLCGMLETSSIADAKVGVQFLNIGNMMRLPDIGLNALVGMRSSGISVSYSLPKPFNNTMAHAYVGYAYTLDTVYGAGVSLNF